MCYQQIESWLSAPFIDRGYSIHQFECTDPRDKLYGVLAMVDWAGVSALVPNYEKDVFDVAVEVIARKEVSTNDYVLVWAHRLTSIFDLHPTDVSIQTRLRARDDATTVSERSAPIWDGNWQGVKILSRSTSVNNQSGLRCTDRSADRSVVTLVDNYDRPFARVCPGPRSGDWYLEMQLLDTTQPWSLIVRASDSGRYTIVGLAQSLHPFRGRTLDPFLSFRDFVVCWDPVDVLLLHQATLQLDGNDIKKLWTIRVCGLTDSSYAIAGAEH
jgi:hypothetical protein